jgi:tetratricopeptide (TPR) repeat protein
MDTTWVVPLPDPSEDADWKRVSSDVRESRLRALARFRAAGREAARQGRALPREHHYWRARALLGLGRLDAAQAALQTAEHGRSARRWKLGTLSAMVAVARGDLQEALELSHRAIVDSPRSARARAYLVYALALDRSEDSQGTRDAMALFHKGRGSSDERNDVESMLPLHERLYLRGLIAATRPGGDAGRARRYFEAYLRQPEPEAPERRLAERHVERLRDIPARIGG